MVATELGAEDTSIARKVRAKQRSTINQAVETMRNKIVLGDFKPGEKLVESKLSDQLGVSRPSVREILRTLMSQRLVDLVPNKGPSVARLTSDDIEDIREVWSLLTGEAVVRFARRANKKEIDQLVNSLEGFHAAIDKGSAAQQLSIINDFFTVITKNCGNIVLSDAIFSLVSRINFLRAESLKERRWSVLFFKELSDLQSQIIAHDAELAQTTVKKHIASSCLAAKQQALLNEYSVDS